MKEATVTLSQAEANTLLLAIEAAMSEKTRGADNKESIRALTVLDCLWSKIMDAGVDAGFGSR